ncbi:protein stoned-A-like [Teleopsis dalmanni]|uniref:protein stoned-A-like n=1 Tax=Teleopsis dalmanni TaxID=139649 RepID=UPI0018CF593E|nr:protein stoned-A-like [Teleopsis dalmanni]
MLKLPKGLKKKKKKSKKDKELFTEEELEQYKRDLKAKQEAAAAKSDAGESDAASDVEGLASTASVSVAGGSSFSVATTQAAESTADGADTATTVKKSEEDEEWAKFKALTSGVDTILHKTQDELDRIKKESFYQRLPSAAEKKRLEEEEAAKREAERLEEERRKAAELEAQRDKLAEAVVELSESEPEDEEVLDDIFCYE